MRPGTPPPSVKTSRTRWPGALGAAMPTSMPAAGTMVLKWMLKPWANMSSLPALEVRADLVGVELGRGLIGDENHDDVGPLGGFGDGGDFKAGLLRLGDGLGVGGEADFDLDAGVLEVESVGVALGAVADDGYFLRLDEGEVGIVIVISLSP